MNHKTVERVARAIYDAMGADIDSVIVGRFDDGDYVYVDGYVNLLVCATEAIRAYREANNSPPANPELKPCPFCGNEAWLYDHGANADPPSSTLKCFDVRCRNCNCPAFTVMRSYTEKLTAIAAWNRRVG